MPAMVDVDNAFPRTAGVPLLDSSYAGEDHRPASRSSSDSFAMGTNPNVGSITIHRSLIDQKGITRPIEYAPPGDKMAPFVNGHRKLQEAKQRSQFFEKSFEYKEAPSAARDRVYRDSPIIAELRTNVIVQDEYSLVMELSNQLSTRYQRPEQSVMITVTHSSCLCFAGTFDPAYVLSITALPSQAQPVTNKRNAALITIFLADMLSVPAERGLIRFCPIAEQNLAINGSTVFGDIEKLEDANGTAKPRPSSKRKSFGRRSSAKDLGIQDGINTSYESLPLTANSHSGMKTSPQRNGFLSASHANFSYPNGRPKPPKETQQQQQQVADPPPIPNHGSNGRRSRTDIEKERDQDPGEELTALPPKDVDRNGKGEKEPKVEKRKSWWGRLKKS